MRAAYQIAVDGAVVTDAFAPLLLSVIITDSDGGKADTLEIELDDTGGQIALPATGAQIQALIWWDEPPAGATPGAVQFVGTIDEVRSRGSREHGRTLVVMGRSADMKTKGKHKHSKHQDSATFGQVAQSWGGTAGYQVSVDPSLASLARDYWVIANESFLSWGTRIAEEIGATFKTAYPKATFVPRNSGSSASGTPLAGVVATWGDNLISWDVSPTLSAGVYANARTRWYDSTNGQWNEDVQSVGSPGATADHRETFKAADQKHAHARTTANLNSARRLQAGVSTELIGDAGALSQANLTIVGARPGVDGQYRIKTARHVLDRKGGWTTTCDAEQPQGAAGTDSRAKSKSSSAT